MRAMTSRLFVAIGAALLVSTAQQPPPDLIILNAKIVTVDQAFSVAEAVAIRGDRFTAVGTSPQIRALATGATRVLDLGGKCPPKV